MTTIYKILTRIEWKQFQNTGKFLGTKLDLKDGYIHMSSTEKQMKRIKQKYYNNEEVFLLHINSNKLDNLKYEPASNGELYPHQYGKLVLDNIIKTENLN